MFVNLGKGGVLKHLHRVWINVCIQRSKKVSRRNVIVNLFERMRASESETEDITSCFPQTARARLMISHQRWNRFCIS